MEMAGLREKRKHYEELILRENNLNEIRFEDEFGSISCPSFRCLNENREHCYCGTVRSEYQKQFYKHFRKDKKSMITNDIPDIRITGNPLLTNQFLEFGNRSKMLKKSSEDPLTEPKANLTYSDHETERTNTDYAMSHAFEDSPVPDEKNARLVSVSDTVFFEKRLLNFFRKIALYWFLCCVRKTEDSEVKNIKIINYGASDGVPSANDSDFCRRRIVELSSVIHGVLPDSSDFHESSSFALNLDHYLKTKFLEVVCREVLQDCSNLFDQSTPVPRPFRGKFDGIAPFKRMQLCTRISAVTSTEFEWKPFRKRIGSGPLIDSFNTVDNSQVVAVHNVDEAVVAENPIERVTKKEINRLADEVDDFCGQLDDPRMLCAENADRDSEIRSQLDESVDVYNFFSFVNCCVEEVGAEKTESTSTENGYFLPPGMLSVEEIDYPQYNLWCTPLIIERQALAGHPVANVLTELVDDDDNFEPYRLWEPSFAVQGGNDRVPNVHFEDECSIFSMPYNPCQLQQQSRTDQKTSSFYSLWASPNIIEFLPAIGCVQLMDGPPSSSLTSSNEEDDSSADSFELVYEAKKSLEIVTDGYGAKEPINFKPATSGLEFTDRGAFEYYRKPAVRNGGDDRAVPNQEAIRFQIASSQPRSGVDGAQNASSRGGQTNTVVGEKGVEDSKKIPAAATCYFKPIQPAFKVPTDAPPLLQRSSSGTYYLQDRKLFSFPREADQQLNDAVKSLVDDGEAFKPKFVVRDNDKACQTENLSCNSFAILAGCRNVHNLYRHSSSSNQVRMIGLDSADVYSGKQPVFYSLNDVFNFIGQPGLTNIDIKNCPDFDNFF